MLLILNKNKQLAAVLGLILALAIIALLLAPPITKSLVNLAYQSNAPLWQSVFQQRHVVGPAAYQETALGILRDAGLLALALALTLVWVLWDSPEERLSLTALSWPRVNARNLAVVGTGALALLSIRGTVPYLLPLLCALVTLLARDPAPASAAEGEAKGKAFTRFNRLLDLLLDRRVSITLVILMTLATFLVKFPLADFDKLVFFDDYPTIYTITVKGWEMLKEGGIFGWDPALMGGYYTVSDVSHNEIFFMLPFMPLGPRVAFHAMILFFYVLFPLLIYAYAKLRFRSERTALLALWIGFFTVFSFFDNMLYWGMVNSFIGMNLMVVNLILFELMRRGKPYASLGLIIALTLTLYAAGGFFVYSLAFIGLGLLWHWDRKLVVRLAFVMAAAFLVSLTYTYTLLRYPDYFIQSDEIYAPQALPLSEIITQSVQALPRVTTPQFWLLGKPVRYQGVFVVSLPILAALAWGLLSRRRAYDAPGKSPVAEFMVLATLVMLTTLVVSPSVDMFVSRIRFVLPVFMALIYASWLSQEKRIHPAPLLIVLTILLTTRPSRLLEPIRHQPSLRAYQPQLLDQIDALDSELILLESMGRYNLATEGPGTTAIHESLVHMEPYFPFETNKRYLANNQEGYHHSLYRRNFITSGAFRGRLLPDWPEEEIEGFLLQWGIKHLVLWSDISKGYFGGNPNFRLLWEDSPWAIYEFPQAQPGHAVLAQGEAEIQVEGYFQQTVHLRDVRQGDLVVLRMNYFPSWRADVNGQAIELLDEDGFLSFLAPQEGTYEVRLRYPRYVGLSALAIVTLLVSLFLAHRFQGTL